MTTTPIAIPQTYKGVRFRSILETNWARTLDAWGMAWSYEPEAFRLPSGSSYLPDFHLPQINTWLEVKGPGVAGIGKFYEFAATRQPAAPEPGWLGARDELFAVGGASISGLPVFSVGCRWCDVWLAGDHDRGAVGVCLGCRHVQFSTYHSPGCGVEARCMREKCRGEKVTRISAADLPFVAPQWQPKRKAGVRR